MVMLRQLYQASGAKQGEQPTTVVGCPGCYTADRFGVMVDQKRGVLVVKCMACEGGRAEFLIAEKAPELHDASQPPAPAGLAACVVPVRVRHDDGSWGTANLHELSDTELDGFAIGREAEGWRWARALAGRLAGGPATEGPHTMAPDVPKGTDS
jgi:hypothetical protein